MIGLCFPCQEKGILRAPYKDVNGKPMCGGCFADYEAAQRKAKFFAAAKPAAAPIADTPLFAAERKTEGPMAERKKIDWDAAQRDRDDGATTTAIAEKYGVSTPTVCAHTKPAGAGAKTRAPKAAKTATPTQSDDDGESYDVSLSPIAMDRIWNSLQPGQKAALLGHL